MGDPYFGEFQLPPIDLGLPGTYEITFWYMMYCESTVCNSAGDSIKLVLNEDGDEPFVFTLSYDNIVVEQRWQSMSFEYSTDETILDVNNKRF